MTLKESINGFIEFLAKNKRSNSTITAYKKDIEQMNQFLSSSKNIFNIEEIETKDLNEYIETLKNDKSNKYTLKTISRKINSLKTFFKFLFVEGKIQSNPALAVKHPKYTVSPPKILSRLEYLALRDVARSNLRLYTIVEILLQTGIRIGELARLKIENINLEKNKKSIIIEKYGNNKKREIEINDICEKAIKNYLKARPEPKEGINSFFVTKNGNKLLVRNIRTSITRAFEKAGIKDATVNDIRNTFIVHQLRSGMPLELVSQISGHKRLTSTKRYLPFVYTKPKRMITRISPL